MKFTKFALASVAAFGLAGVASADTTYVADSLESWEDLTKSPQTGYSVEGTESEAGQHAVWFGGKDGDETKVMAYADEGAPAAYSGKRPGGMDAANNNYLKVSNSDPLWRMLKEYSKDEVTGDWPASFPVDPVDLGEGTGDAGLFVDTLVQFTPSEDVPDVEPGSKLIVWMDAASNLCVTAGYITYGSVFTSTPTNFVTNKRLNSGTWYRLTVSAYSQAASSGDDIVNGFTVKIDGEVVTAIEPVMEQAAVDQFDYASELSENDGWWPTPLELVNAKQMFTSLAYGEPSATLAAVGFKGEGLVDDIVVTDVPPTFDPVPAGGIDFTLTWGADVSAVWYSIDGGTTKVDLDTVPVEAIALPATVKAGDELIIGGTAADAWSTVAETTNTLAASDNAYTVTATAAATAGAAGVTDEALADWTVAQVKAAFGDTVTPAAIEAADAPYLDYQFGQDLGTLSEAPDVKITDIAETAGGWDITVQMFKGTDALDIETGTGSEGSKTIKAALKVKQAATLAGLATAEPETYELAFDDDKTDITVTVTTGSFFKAYVEFAAAPSVE